MEFTVETDNREEYKKTTDEIQNILLYLYTRVPASTCLLKGLNTVLFCFLPPVSRINKIDNCVIVQSAFLLIMVKYT